MRRFVTLFVLFLSSIPFGVSISGCAHNEAPEFCNGGDSGPTTTQAATITLQPIVYGISLNYGELGQLQRPTATDCKGGNVSVQSFTYGSSDMTIADVQPTTGRLCAGTWNRNSGGGIADFTYCTPTNKSGIAYVDASFNGATSNPLPVFVHPVVTSIVLGGPSSNCSTDPTTACCPLATVGAVTAPPYLAGSCISQGKTAQLVARVYAGSGANQTNISCVTGHLQLSAQGATSLTTISPVLSIDPNGVATANQPGSVLISANISGAASSAGFFSTCPPASITLTTPGITSNPAVVNQNNPQPLLANVLDTNGVALSGLALEYVSTTPTTIPAGANGVIIPPFAGAASITAVCQPPACNPSSYNQIGLFGNGLPVTSNSVNISAPGTNSTVLYMASTQSEDVVQVDFTTSVVGSPYLLPYVPNSMVIADDGSTIYMGSATALMVLNAINTLSITRTDSTSPGTVLAVSPNNSALVISDPVRQIISLESATGGIISTYGGVATHAEFTPDSQTVYITAGNQLLVYSADTGWTSKTTSSPVDPLVAPVTDVAITVPAVGAYFAGQTTTARSYCPISTPTTPTNESNVFYPPADSSPATTDRIAATNDGLHILGATASTANPTLTDLRLEIPAGNGSGVPVSVACPQPGPLNFSNTNTLDPAHATLTPVTATAITGVLPTSDSSVAFVTYTGSGGVLPAYAPSASGQGTTTFIKLSGAATAPIAGVISADNSTMYAATSGDNLVHLITRSTLTDTSTLAPNLTSPTGAIVPVDLMVQKPRKTT